MKAFGPKEAEKNYLFALKAKGKTNSKTTVLDTDVTLKNLGERIKQLRIKKGYTSYEYFAYDHNISRAQFGRYEQGQDLRISSHIKCNAFGISLSKVLANLYAKKLLLNKMSRVKNSGPQPFLFNHSKKK